MSASLPYMSPCVRGGVRDGFALVASLSLSLTPRTDHLQRKGGRSVEGGAQAGGEGTWRIRQGVKERGQGHGVLRKHFSSFTRRSRHGFLCAYSELDDGRDGARVLRALQCLLRELFIYFTSKKFSSHFYAFPSALFGLSVFYTNQLYFQLFRMFFRRVLPISLFRSGTGPQRAQHDPLQSLTQANNYKDHKCTNGMHIETNRERTEKVYQQSTT